MDSNMTDVDTMEKVNSTTENFWSPTAKNNQYQEEGAAKDFSQILADIKNPTPKSSGKSEDGETKTIMQRNVITGAGGEQIIVFTLVTTDASGKVIDSKVISKQKINAATPEDSIQSHGVMNKAPLTNTDEKNMPYATADRARKEYEYNSAIDSEQMYDLLNTQG